MLISGKYRLGEPWEPGQAAAVEAEEVVSGKRVFLHFLEKGNPAHRSLHQQARKFLADVPPESRSQPFDLGEHEGTLFLVTPAQSEFQALDEAAIQDWIEWQIKGHELRSRLRQSARLMQDLRAQDPYAADEGDTQVLAPGAGPVSKPASPPSVEARPAPGTPPRPDQPAASPEASAEKSEPGDFTQLFQPSAQQASPTPADRPATSASTPQTNSKTADTGEFIRSFNLQGEEEKDAKPPAEPPRQSTEQAGEFTKLFSPGAAASPTADVPAASSMEKGSAKPEGNSAASEDQAGDFTRIFQGRIPKAGAAEPIVGQPSKVQAPAGTTPPVKSEVEPHRLHKERPTDPGQEGPGEFTQMWGGLSSSPASQSGPPASQAGSLPWQEGAAQDATPGEFTRIFRGGSAASPGRGPSAPSARPSDQNQQQDDFGRMFGPDKPRSAPSSGTGADATRIFEDRPQGLPGLEEPQERGPSEYTQFMQASSIPVNQGAAETGAPVSAAAAKPEADAAVEVKKSKDAKPGAALNYLILALVFCALLLLALAAVVFFSPSQPPAEEAGQAEQQALPEEGSNAADAPSGSGASSVRTPSVRTPSARAPSVRGPSVRGPSVSGTSVTKPSVTKPSVSKPSVRGPSARLSTPSSRGAAQPAATGSASPLLAVVLVLIALLLIATAVVVYFALVKKSG